MRGKIVTILSVVLVILPSCRSVNKIESKITGLTQGTTYSVIWYHGRGESVEKVRNGIEELLMAIDNSLSTYNPGSVISRVNSNEEVVLDTMFINVFKRSYEIWALTGGAFDITAAPLINAWGFGPDATRRFNESIKDRLMELVGMDKIKIVDGMVVKSDPDMCLDVNAIAQGYTVDLLSYYLSSRGFDCYLVEVGGEVRTRGTKAGSEPWIIGLDKPADGNFTPGLYRQADIKLVDKALATSGNYRKFYIEDGIKYSHTIDPKTGYPVKHKLLSATVIADDCTTADALATACMVVGLEKAREMILDIGGLDAYLVYSDEEGEFKTWFTDGMIGYLSD